VPPGVVVVSESGIGDAAARQYVGSLGVHAILVGEGLITSGDIASAVGQMSGLSQVALEGAGHGAAIR
jgi:indole-3-glycerol phosphate synthase